MSSSFAVSGTSQTQHRQSPFDQILSVEREQEHRLREEVAQLEKQRISEEESLRAKKFSAFEEINDERRENIERFTNTELPMIIKDHKQQGASEAARIKRESIASVPAAAKHIVDFMLSSDFLSLI